MDLGTDVSGPIAAAQRAAIEALLGQRELAPRQRERLEMVKAAWLRADVATHLETTPSLGQVWHWGGSGTGSASNRRCRRQGPTAA